MTIDEAINILKQYIDYNNPDIPDFYTMEEACKVVINALEQQVTDAVDRVTIKEYLDSYEVAQPKLGYWISNAEDDLKISEYTCSNCKGLSDEDSDFCPKCGSYNGGVGCR